MKNEGSVEIANVVVRSSAAGRATLCPGEPGGAYANGEVAWNVGSLRAGEEIVLEVTTECQKASPGSLMSCA